MTLISPLVNPNQAGGERSVSPADPHVCGRPGERSAENLWSTIRHHTSSWSLLWRLLVLVVGIAVAATTLRWFRVPSARTASAR
jgi:hypothetical protein